MSSANTGGRLFIPPAPQRPKLGRNDPCWCGSGKKYKVCHERMDERIESIRLEGHIVPGPAQIKNKEQIEGIRESSKLNIAILDMISEKIQAGMSTQDIDDLVYNKTKEMGGIPAPLNYEGFPKSVCTSLNDEVCHGIPSKDIIIKDGDIINVDCSTIYKGYFSDSSRMFCIGDVSPEKKKLVEVAKECMQKGIDAVKPWTFLGDMADAVNSHAKANGYTIVREIGGHGVGIEFHEEPFVSYVTRPGTEMLMVPGMVFTIEPMVNMGKADIYTDEDNGWTVYTEDGKPSAQWEVTLAVTEDGCEILTY
ncbi:MAG: methionyl aminopeptidase [Lachnospiraceae bacterium]|nr:methionyl aminopeptidase [Lachnospiraceae bacterium]